MVCFYVGRDQKIFHLQRTMEIGDQRGRGARPLRADWGGTKKFFISRELWRLEIRAVEEQRPFWELPWRPRAGLRALSRRKKATTNSLFYSSRGNMTLGS